MQRLILQSVKLSEGDAGAREAVVVLTAGEREFIGRSLCAEAEDDLAAVALATIESLKQYLPEDVSLRLKKAAKMQHETIHNNLLIVSLDYTYRGEQSALTGSCLSNDEQAAQNIAKATLDATNRLCTFLLENQEEN